MSSTPLTSGERARIALLKAVVEDRPVFVFDEWAIDQDHVYKEFFYQEFLPKLRNARKLVVVISDDERYFHTADRLLWLERGSRRSGVRPRRSPWTPAVTHRAQ